jgi:hypothetical protein
MRAVTALHRTSDTSPLAGLQFNPRKGTARCKARIGLGLPQGAFAFPRWTHSARQQGPQAWPLGRKALPDLAREQRGRSGTSGDWLNIEVRGPAKAGIGVRASGVIPSLPSEGRGGLLVIPHSGA